MSRSCIIDVGANEGDFAIEVAKKNANVTVIAFEPIPQLRALIESRARSEGLTNLLIREEAILDTPGNLVLNVANHADMGVSSLLNFNPENIKHDHYWRTRTDLYHEERIEVKVERLDKILKELAMESVEFIKIDAQGVDLQVLASLGEFRPKAGMLEAATTRFKTLYVGEPDLLETLSRLRESGFEVWDIKPNDPACAEVNVYFADESSNIREIESRYSLLEISIYGEKHYWFANASSADEAERRAYAGLDSGPLNLVRQEIAALHRRVRGYRIQAVDLLARGERLEETVRENTLLRTEILAMRNSKTWRLTRVFRSIAAPFFRSR